MKGTNKLKGGAEINLYVSTLTEVFVHQNRNLCEHNKDGAT